MVLRCSQLDVRPSVAATQQAQKRWLRGCSLLAPKLQQLLVQARATLSAAHLCMQLWQPTGWKFAERSCRQMLILGCWMDTGSRPWSWRGDGSWTLRKVTGDMKPILFMSSCGEL
ncbi:unnamed protein product [Symbiodinium necroappetens]|uniref:Uncharacterized protein n=1 Tax=Symbiodinium necroappetens TaxID=1628268 RepID=A0A812XAG3_9DINO|nr:unnamed protein product [Symbiodinium necroappetens]